VVWLASALLFATNVVREHYPAMALARHGSLRCDEYAGLSPDLFQHLDRVRGDGHWYANNNVGASLVAAPLLAAFEPLFVRLDGARDTDHFDSPYPMRQKFMAEVRRRGLHLRFGATTAITSALLMAPAAALLALLMYDLLRRREVAEPRAGTLALLFAFTTPLLFRSAILSHNQLEALVGFMSYVLLDQVGPPQSAQGGSSIGPPQSARTRSSAKTLALAGLLAGTTVLFDYSGVVLLGAIGLLAVGRVVRTRRDSGGSIVGPLAAFVVGAALPIGLLLFTQWWQFGDAFAPAQRWMPDAHYSVNGWHGFDVPHLDLVVKNLLDPSFGLFAFAPILLLALWPARAAAHGGAVDGSRTVDVLRRDRLFALALSAAFVLFCAANQFTRLQWNTGFRGLAPLVPFLFLAASPILARLRGRALALVAAPCVAHSLVLAMARATPPTEPTTFAESTVARSWTSLFEHGVQLPWLTVWRQTQPHGGPAWASFAAPAIVALATLLALALWRAGARVARASPMRSGA
jgi:hypothetical protein